jgi:hypothetical protein
VNSTPNKNVSSTVVDATGGDVTDDVLVVFDLGVFSFDTVDDVIPIEKNGVVEDDGVDDVGDDSSADDNGDVDDDDVVSCLIISSYF